MTPALYWRSRVRYPEFSIDYFFIDSNIFDAFDPFKDINHNICSIAHNEIDASCAAEGGPESTAACPEWFRTLWNEQSDWLEWQLSASDADWQIVVTHFPPTFGRKFWKHLSAKYGIDLIITGHLHRQEVHVYEEDNFLAPTGWIVSGGGGGVTSDWAPDHAGDESYGFMQLTLSKDTITIRNVDHLGHDTRVAVVQRRHCDGCVNATRANGSVIGQPWEPPRHPAHNTSTAALVGDDHQDITAEPPPKSSSAEPSTLVPLVHDTSE